MEAAGSGGAAWGRPATGASCGWRSPPRAGAPCSAAARCKHRLPGPAAPPAERGRAGVAAGRGARSSSTWWRSREPASAATARTDLPRPAGPQLPPLLHRPGHLGERHLDAERSPSAWLVLSDRLHGSRARRRVRHRPAVPAHAALRDLGRPGGRPGGQAPPALRHPERRPASWPSLLGLLHDRHGRPATICGRSTLLAFCSGVVNLFDNPARQTFVIRDGRARTTCPTPSASTASS